MNNYGKRESAERRYVAAVFAVIVEISDDDEAANAHLEEIGVLTNDGIERALATKTGLIQFPGATSFVWEEHSNANIYRCDYCRKFFSANNKGCLVYGLPEGYKDATRSRCLECEQIRERSPKN